MLSLPLSQRQHWSKGHTAQSKPLVAQVGKWASRGGVTCCRAREPQPHAVRFCLGLWGFDPIIGSGVKDQKHWAKAPFLQGDPLLLSHLRLSLSLFAGLQ